MFVGTRFPVSEKSGKKKSLDDDLMGFYEASCSFVQHGDQPDYDDRRKEGGGPPAVTGVTVVILTNTEGFMQQGSVEMDGWNVSDLGFHIP